MVSRYLEQMEQWAGARLIHRSTRRLTLTPPGRRCCKDARLTQLSDEIAGNRACDPQRHAARRLRALYRDAADFAAAARIFSPVIRSCAWSWISITIRSA
jgi:DNA-binding transcriptional LysR family regulator